jgi:hypothetical protein
VVLEQIVVYVEFVINNFFIGSHAETLCTSLCKHLVVDKLSDQLRQDQAEVIGLAAAVMSFLLEDVGYFHPPSFNCFLSILTCLKGE